MNDGAHPPASHFFTLRLWRAEAGDGQTEWRGKLQHVLSGESRYFQNWPALVASLRGLLPESRGAGGAEREEDAMI
jgi:hypothetical protein